MGLVNCKYNFECWTISILKRTYGHKSVSLAIHTVLQLINDINRECFSKPSLQNESFMHSFKYVCNLSWVQSGKLQKAKVATIEAENFLPATPTLCHVLVWNLESCPLKSIDMFASNPVGRKSWLSERKKPAAQSLTSKAFDQILRLIEWETRREREREREHLLQFFTVSHEVVELFQPDNPVFIHYFICLYLSKTYAFLPIFGTLRNTTRRLEFIYG